MKREREVPDVAPTETFALEAPDGNAAPAENKAPHVPTYRVGQEDGESVVFRSNEDGSETKLTDGDEAPAETWAELLGYVDPQPQMTRDAQGRVTIGPRVAASENRAWIHKAAQVWWGGDDKKWAPGAPGKMMTLEAYESFVAKGQNARATGTGIPPVDLKKDGDR